MLTSCMEEAGGHNWTLFFLPVLFLLRGPGGAESTLRHISAHFCHQLLSRSRAHFILWFHLSRLFLYFIFYNGDLSKWDAAVSCLTHLWDAQVRLV